MNIVFLTKYFPPDSIGGGEISAYYLAKSLSARGHRLTILKKGKENKKGFKREGLEILERKDLFTKEVPNFEKRWAKSRAPILASQIPKGTDLIHAHDFHSALILSELKLSGSFQKSTVATIRDYWPVCGYGKVRMDASVCPGCVTWRDFRHCPKVVRGNLIQKFVRAFRYHHNIPYRQRALSAIDQIVYISKALKQEIANSKNQTSGQRGYVVYNPIPLDWHRGEIPSKSDGKTLLFAGLLDLHKGFDVLLRALKIVKESKVEFKLTVAGTGQSFLQYKRLASKLGIKSRVNFLGRIPYRLMRDLYRKSDIVVAPSSWPEPFGRTVIEGMLLACAVIATDHGAPPEFIQDNENGILVRPRDSEGLAEKIILLLKNPGLRKRLGAEARKYVLNHFDPDKIAKQYETIYCN